MTTLSWASTYEHDGMTDGVGIDAAQESLIMLTAWWASAPLGSGGETVQVTMTTTQARAMARWLLEVTQ